MIITITPYMAKKKECPKCLRECCRGKKDIISKNRGRSPKRRNLRKNNKIIKKLILLISKIKLDK